MDRVIAGGSDGVTFGHGVSARHTERPERREGDRETVRRADRQRRAAAGDSAGKADRPSHRRVHTAACHCVDCDAAVLARRIRVSLVEVEGLHDRPANGPRPRERTGDRSEEQEDDRDEPMHGHHSLCCQMSKREGEGTGSVLCCQI
jgi:hypothetical protein